MHKERSDSEYDLFSYSDCNTEPLCKNLNIVLNEEFQLFSTDRHSMNMKGCSSYKKYSLAEQEDTRGKMADG